jgi:hypothetical protein
MAIGFSPVAAIGSPRWRPDVDKVSSEILGLAAISPRYPTHRRPLHLAHCHADRYKPPDAPLAFVQAMALCRQIELAQNRRTRLDAGSSRRRRNLSEWSR